MGVRVAVAGASGYAGGELLRIVGGHPDLELGPLAAAASAGAPVTVAHPHLAHLGGHTFEPLHPARLSSADLVFLALPHEESAAVSAALPAGTPVVDLSASFRLADPQAWSVYYRTPHAGQWCYGLPELPGARERIAAARRVAAPGCYATAAILALAPLVVAGLAGPRDIVIVAASGTSGAGRSPSAALLATEVIGSMSAYQVGGTHRHTPEIEQALRLAMLARGGDPPGTPRGADGAWPASRQASSRVLARGGKPPPGTPGAGPGGDPPEPPESADGAWPASRQASSRVLARAAGGPGRPTAPMLVLALFIALAYLEILRSLVMHRCFRLDGPASSCAGTHFCLVSGDAAGRRPTARGVAGNSYHGRMRSPARRVRSENGPG